MRNISQKILSVFRKLRKKIAQNSLRFMCKNSAKVCKKKNCAKIAQILRKRFSHFVETLLLPHPTYQLNTVLSDNMLHLHFLIQRACRQTAKGQMQLQMQLKDGTFILLKLCCTCYLRLNSKKSQMNCASLIYR